MTVNVLGSINTGRVVGVRELRQAQVHSLPDVDQCRGHVAGGARTPVTSAISIMASGPITSWQIDGETVEAVTAFILGGFKITADDDCSREIKRLLGRKAMTNLDSILKSRDITLPTKVHLVKGMVFPVVMCGWESWTVKKGER